MEAGAQAMPLPGNNLATGRSESEDLDEAVALSLAGPEGPGTSPTALPPQSRVSFAHMAKMGFAASGMSWESVSSSSSSTLSSMY